MSASVTNANPPISVEVYPGSTPPAPPAITGFAFDAETGSLQVSFSDGSSLPIPGLAAAIAQSLGGAQLAIVDTNGSLLLGGKPRWGVSPAGNLTAPTPLPDTTDGYTPVAGSGEVYLDGSGPMEIA